MTGGSFFEAPVAWFKQAPRTLQALIVFGFARSVVFQVVTGFSHVPLSLLGFAAGIAFDLMLLRRWRWAWRIYLAGGVLVLATAPFSSTPWWSLAATALVELPLLLAPSTRRFIFGPRPTPARSSQASLDPAADSDSERPSGWYIDPAKLGRMRYWHEEDGWLGTARTPRKVRREWRA